MRKLRICIKHTALDHNKKLISCRLILVLKVGWFYLRCFPEFLACSQIP